MESDGATACDRQLRYGPGPEVAVRLHTRYDVIVQAGVHVYIHVVPERLDDVHRHRQLGTSVIPIDRSQVQMLRANPDDERPPHPSA